MTTLPRRAACAATAVLSLLLTSACTDGGDATGSGAATPSATSSPRPTIAAAVPDGTVAARFVAKGTDTGDQLVSRINALPGVLGTGYFASEARIVVRLKPDVTAAQIEALIAALRAEKSLADIEFEAAPSSGSAAPSATPTSA